MAKKINWLERSKKHGFKTVLEYLVSTLPKKGQVGIAKDNNVALESVRNIIAACGLIRVKNDEYVMIDTKDKVRVIKEHTLTTEHEDAINLCIPAAERLAKEVGIPFLEAMNRITIAKGLRHSKEWILEQRSLRE